MCVVTRYARPSTIAEAVELLNVGDVSVLAGGTDLVLMRMAGKLTPTSLVDVKAIPELVGISVGSEETLIGAAATLDTITRAACLRSNALVDGAALVGSWQTRSRATLGGNVCRASPAGDTLCGLLVLGGRLELASTRGVRHVAAAEFFTGPGTTLRTPDELLTRISFSARCGGSAYARLTYRNAMDLAVVGVAVWLEMQDRRCVEAAVAIGACGPAPLLVPTAARALIGSPVDGDAIEAACTALIAAATPIDDIRGTRQYRLHVLRPLSRRVMLRALARANDAERDRGT
jgi:carbon-monoxide dehydrogenase medium subunit